MIKADLNPIFIIGSARSGTTMLGDILSKHPDIAYWVEPKYIWNYRNPNLNNDIRNESEATEPVIKFIQKTFLKHQIIKGKNRFMEKTPSNCFKIPFIDKVYPNALYINIIRDGRDVCLSAYKKWTEKHEKSAYLRRLNIKEYPLIDLPNYFFDFLIQFCENFLPQKNSRKWGPITPNIITYRNKSIIEACAFQWRESVEVSINNLNNLNKERVFNIKYEEFIKEPQVILSKIFHFASLNYSPEVISFAKDNINKLNYEKWKKHKELISRVNYILEPTLIKLDYI